MIFVTGCSITTSHRYTLYHAILNLLGISSFLLSSFGIYRSALMKVILHSNQISSRLRYITDFFSKQIFGEPFVLTNDSDEFKNADSIRINYSVAPITEKEIHFTPHTLLFEDGIQLQRIECFEWEGLKVFFKTEGDIPFDIFSAAFYLL